MDLRQKIKEIESWNYREIQKEAKAFSIKANSKKDVRLVIILLAFKSN